MGKTHKIGGAVLGVSSVSVAMCVTNFNVSPIFVGLPLIAASTIGVFIPDIDSRQSTISRKLFLIAWPIWVLQSLTNFFLKKSKSKVAKSIRSTINHRGFAHWASVYLLLCLISLIFCVLTLPSNETNLENITLGINGLIQTKTIFYSITHTVLFSFIFGLWIGALSHILLDALNYQGVPLFAPISLKKVSFGKIATSSKEELKFRKKLKFIYVILLILFVLLSLQYFGLFDVKLFFESIFKSFDKVTNIKVN